jgi:hypothetical protein
MNELPFEEGANALDLTPQTVHPMPIAAPQQAPTPMMLLQMAMSQNADLDKLAKLMDLQDRWEANEARKAFNAAFAGFKAEAIQIVKNISVTDGPLKGKKYADLYAVVDAVTPALSKHGLHHSWKLTKDEKDWLEVTCYIKHNLGHCETASMGGPPDAGGAKSAIQARASSKSYLERYTLLGITGLASCDGDSDGRADAGKAFGMAEDAFQGHLKAMREAKDTAGLQAVFTAAWKAAGNDKPTKDALLKVKEECKAKTMGGGK